jgi:hypothetical protein
MREAPAGARSSADAGVATRGLSHLADLRGLRFRGGGRGRSAVVAPPVGAAARAAGGPRRPCVAAPPRAAPQSLPRQRFTPHGLEGVAHTRPRTERVPRRHRPTCPPPPRVTTAAAQPACRSAHAAPRPVGCLSGTPSSRMRPSRRARRSRKPARGDAFLQPRRVRRPRQPRTKSRTVFCSLSGCPDPPLVQLPSSGSGVCPFPGEAPLLASIHLLSHWRIQSGIRVGTLWPACAAPADPPGCPADSLGNSPTEVAELRTDYNQPAHLGDPLRPLGGRARVDRGPCDAPLVSSPPPAVITAPPCRVPSRSLGWQ